jgi:hypothetical protein
MFICSEETSTFQLQTGKESIVEATAFNRCVLLLSRMDEGTIMSNTDVREIRCEGVDWLHVIQYGGPVAGLRYFWAHCKNKLGGPSKM